MNDNKKIVVKEKKTAVNGYVQAVAWFSVLWATKVFLFEPIYNKIKNDKGNK